MIDYNADLFDPAFSVLGVPATLTMGINSIALTVIDETRSKVQASSGVEVRSVGPIVSVRMSELIAKGLLEPKDYVGATLTFNGRNWLVRSHEPQGSPNGEDVGLVKLPLKAIGSTSG